MANFGPLTAEIGLPVWGSPANLYGFLQHAAMLAFQALYYIDSYGNSVCVSVRLSHAGIVSKRRHVARCSFHRWMAKCV